MGGPTWTLWYIVTMGAHFGPYLISTQRVWSLSGLYSHVYDVRDPCVPYSDPILSNQYDYDVREHWGLNQTTRNVEPGQVGASPNTLLFGNAFSMDPFLLTQPDCDISDVQPRSIRYFVHTKIERQATLIDAAIQSQTFKSLLTQQIYENDTKRIHGLRNSANVSQRLRMITLVPLIRYPLQHLNEIQNPPF